MSRTRATVVLLAALAAALACAPLRERRRTAAHPVLAAAHLAALRAQEPPGRRSGRRPRGPGGARLRDRRRRAGARRLQGPRRQAAAGGQDDGPPLPLLRPGRVNDTSRARASTARLHHRPRRGAPERASSASSSPLGLPRPLRDREPHGRRQGADVAADRDGREPLPAREEVLRAHEGRYDRAAHAAVPVHRRRLQHADQRHVLRRAGRRPAGLPVQEHARWTVPAGFNARIYGATPTTTAAREPHAAQRHVRTAGSTTRTPTTAPEPPVQHDPPDPPRARARSPTAPSGR